MIAVAALVEQKRWRLTHIHDDDIHIAIIVNVAERSSAAAGCWNRRKNRGDIFERAISMVAKQQHGLLIAGAAGNRIDLRIDVTVSDKYVRPGIVIHVEKRCSPTDQGEAGLCQFTGPAYVGE